MFFTSTPQGIGCMWKIVCDYFMMIIIIIIGGEGRRVLATGGASGNNSLLQVLADVFNCPVYTMVSCHMTLVLSTFSTNYQPFTAVAY